MPTKDLAQKVKDVLAASWAPTQPGVTVTLHVDDDYRPAANSCVLLVADDGGPAVHGGAWLLRKDLRRPLMRLTAFAKGRTTVPGVLGARNVVEAAADWLIDNHHSAGITRIEDVSDPLITRDRATGAFLASVTMPVIVKPVAP